MAVVVVTAPTRDRARSAPSGRDGDGGLSPPPVIHMLMWCKRQHAYLDGRRSGVRVPGVSTHMPV